MSKSEYDLTEDAPRYVVEALAAVREQDPKQALPESECVDPVGQVAAVQ